MLHAGTTITHSSTYSPPIPPSKFPVHPYPSPQKFFIHIPSSVEVHRVNNRKQQPTVEYVSQIIREYRSWCSTFLGEAGFTLNLTNLMTNRYLKAAIAGAFLLPLEVQNCSSKCIFITASGGGGTASEG